jgi:hypothetical protein
MTVKTSIKSILLGALVALALGGFLLHTRVHPIEKNASNFVPFITGILGVIVVPLLYLSKRTISYGYVLNGFSVIVGTVTMAHFSIVHFPSPFALKSIFLNTLLADILLLWGNFFVGKALFDLETFGYAADKEKKGKPFRYPNMGWWFVHLAAVSLVYYIGNLFWRQP